jgi:ribonuclease G
MKKEIIINASLNEVRVAITEDSDLAEFMVEMPDKERFVGNVYKGKVSKVVTGINAAFINIGLKQDAFLHFSDIDESLENTIIEEDDDEEEENDNSNKKNQNNKNKSNQSSKNQKSQPPKSPKNNDDIITFETKKSGKVQINLEEGQEVIVQVTREAYANKGMKVTSKIAIPGRYLVLLPYDEMLGVSRKIASFKERKRLRYAVRSFKKDNYGCIIRTASKSKTDEELKIDWNNLVDVWKEIDSNIKRIDGPGLVYQDFQLAQSVVRDLFTTQVQRIVVDSKKVYREINSYIKRVSPHLENKIELYTGKKSIFEEFGIERELAKTYRRRVNLKNGGDIVIEHTEAMVVIDVNSGRTSEKFQENNALNTNLEAMKEACKQIRLRDIGGMIIVDFIDMSLEKNGKRLFYEMKKELSRDRAKTILYPLSQIGLMQMTRQRINQNTSEKITEVCPVCKGSGRVTSKTVLVNEIERWLRNFRKHSREFRLELYVHPSVAQHISEGTISIMSRLMIKYFVKIKLQQSDSIKIDHFKFFSVRQQKDITSEYLIK